MSHKSLRLKPLALAASLVCLTSTAHSSDSAFWLGVTETPINPDYQALEDCRRHCDVPQRLRSIEFWNNTRIGIQESQFDLPDTLAAKKAARFLAQTTFGPTAQSVAELAAAIEEEGELPALSRWLDEQMALPTTRMTDKVANATNWLHTSAWWHQSITAPDQLRQRVAFALNHVMTISLSGTLTKDGTLVDYYDTLADHAFGNHRELIEAVTWHVGMLVWLDNQHNNRKTGQANENYARELMQLFTLGLERLNPDGTVQTGEDGQVLESYTEQDVVALAKALSGLTRGGRWYGSGKLRRGRHFKGEKTLFAGSDETVTLSGASAQSDIREALDAVSQHPNVAPFLALRLIQHLVTSNPSSDYIARVSAAFNGDDSGIRGDLKATIKAVLLDPEARTEPAADDANGGRLKAPVMRLTNLFRAFEVDPHHRLSQQIKATQIPLLAPTVFSWFQADDSAAGPIAEAGLVAPEFQLAESNDLARLHNALYQNTLEQGYRRGIQRRGRFSRFNLEREAALALADPEQLIQRYNLLLMGGTMTAQMYEALLGYLEGLPEGTSGEAKARQALYLVMTSPQQAIQR